MNFLGVLFLNPWLLTFLLGLPLLWKLLKATPPPPKTISFSAMMFLEGLTPLKTTAQSAPWWLVLLRVLLVVVLIVAAAHPVARQGTSGVDKKAIVLLVDNTAAAAKAWQPLKRAMITLGDTAIARDAPLYVVPLVGVATLAPFDKQSWEDLKNTLTPLPWLDTPIPLAETLNTLAENATLPLEIQFLSSGLLTKEQQLQLPPSLKSYVPDKEAQLTASIREVERVEGGVKVRAHIYNVDVPHTVVLLNETGQVVARKNLSEGEAVLPVPFAVRKDIRRVELEGATTLLEKYFSDSRWQQPSMGIIAPDDKAVGQNLLEERYYLQKAAAIFTEITQGTVEKLLAQKVPVLLWADSVPLREQERAALTAWVKQGGVLLRFAGDSMATTKEEGLLPVALRYGVQEFATAVAWGKPPEGFRFTEKTPLALNTQHAIALKKRVLAEPRADLAAKTWATFSDGAPLLTAAQQGQGWLLLLHVAANPVWSDFVLQAAFIEVLKNASQLATGGALLTSETLPVKAYFDAFGNTQPPLSTMQGLTGADIAAQWITQKHPAGFYGNERGQQARNVAGLLPKFMPLPEEFKPQVLRDIVVENKTNWQLLLVKIAIGLFLLDWVLTLLLGRQRRWLVAMVVVCLLPLSAQAAEDVPQESLAYIRTGYADVDQNSAKGLEFLTKTLAQRTNATLGAVRGVTLGEESLSPHPLLYFPLVGAVPNLSDKAWFALQQYIANDGVLLIDTRTGQDPFSDVESVPQLQGLLRSLGVMPLVALPDKHLLLRSYYLLPALQGKFAGGVALPVAALGNDVVAGVLLTSNDFAQSWALEGVANKEQAFRSGANVVMYALTGTYKNDQIHLQAVLERLGQ